MLVLMIVPIRSGVKAQNKNLHFLTMMSAQRVFTSTTYGHDACTNAPYDTNPRVMSVFLNDTNMQVQASFRSRLYSPRLQDRTSAKISVRRQL